MLHIVLPVHNRVAITARFLSALVAQPVDDYMLVLVDDGCTDDTVAIVRRHVPGDRLQVLHGDGNLWWAGALQRAYEHLRTSCRPDDAVLLINDDVRFGPDFLTNGLRLLAAEPGSCFQAVGVDPATGTEVRGVVADLRHLQFRAAAPGEQPNCLATRGLLMRGAVFLRSGGFRPRWLPHYLSDYEFTLRLHRQGVPLRCDGAFRAEFDPAATGDERYARDGLRRCWTRAFSNRAKYNPLHWSAFVLMVCPPASAPRHLVGIWGRFARALWQAMRPTDLDQPAAH